MRTKRDKITQTRLKTLFHYDPETGVFTRIKSVGYQAREGQVVGSYLLNGYAAVGIDRVRYYLHRLAWLYIHGYLPPRHTDHINGDPLDNRIANLRLATASQNVSNGKGRTNNTSGVKGLRWSRRHEKWIGEVRKNYKTYRTRCYSEKEEAVEALNFLRDKLHQEFSNRG